MVLVVLLRLTVARAWRGRGAGVARAVSEPPGVRELWLFRPFQLQRDLLEDRQSKSTKLVYHKIITRETIFPQNCFPRNNVTIPSVHYFAGISHFAKDARKVPCVFHMNAV